MLNELPKWDEQEHLLPQGFARLPGSVQVQPREQAPQQVLAEPHRGTAAKEAAAKFTPPAGAMSSGDGWCLDWEIILLLDWGWKNEPGQQLLFGSRGWEAFRPGHCGSLQGFRAVPGHAASNHPKTPGVNPCPVPAATQRRVGTKLGGSARPQHGSVSRDPAWEHARQLVPTEPAAAPPPLSRHPLKKLRG